MLNFRPRVLTYFFLLFFLLSMSYFLLHKQAPHDSNPNVLLITIDSLRPDHLGCYGYQRNTSPNIDKLAKEGVIFTQAICQIPETQSSVASFFTSSQPFFHYRDYMKNWSYLNPGTISLAKILKKTGYHTSLITDFEEPNQIFAIHNLKNDFNTYSKIRPNNPAGLTKKALAWLRKNKNRKFFLYLHYFGSHVPYAPSLPYSEIYLHDRHNNIDRDIPTAQDNYYVSDNIEKNITSLNYYICKYDGKVRVIDEQIGILLEGLKKIGLSGKTMVILISDHGESLGEHNLYFQHVYTLYDELIKVPFIINYPGIIPANRQIDDQVQLLDVAPTILDILGIGYHNYSSIEGISLFPFILEKKKYMPYYAFGIGHRQIKYFIRSKDWKLIYEDYRKIKDIKPDFQFPPFLKEKNNFPAVYELYNLKEDSAEIHNLVEERKEEYLLLREKLNEYIAKAEREVAKAKLQAEEYLSHKTIKSLDGQARKKLKGLGYLQ